MFTRRRLFWVILSAAVTLLVVVVLTAIITAAVKSTSIRHTQNSNTKVTKNSADTLKLVKDCVTPGGKCYERGQAQTAAAVGTLSDNTKAAAAAAAACAAQPEIQNAPSVGKRTLLILNCMNGNLPRETKTP